MENSSTSASVDHALDKLPDHLLVEIFIRVPISEWAVISCVRKQWATLFRGETLWHTALIRTWPSAGRGKRWPGPIPRGLSKRRYAALYVSKHVLFDGEIDELVGHTYLFLKEQLELSPSPPSGILHGTIIGFFLNPRFQYQEGFEYNDSIRSGVTKVIERLAPNVTFAIEATREIAQFRGKIGRFGDLTAQAAIGIMNPDQFIACGKSRDKAHELASQIWLAVINNLEENEHTFLLLKRLAQEGDVFLPYPYSKSYEVQWRVFEKLFTDFRDCFNHGDYYDILACAKQRFQPIPSAWLGY